MPEIKSFATRRLRPFPSRPPEDLPETVAEFVGEALENPPAPPSRPSPAPQRRKRFAGIWEDMTPEQRSAHAKKLAAMRQNKNMARPHKRPRGPKGWAAEDAAAAKAQALLKAEAMTAKLIEDGKITPDDTEGARATVRALARLHTPGGDKRERERAARRLLKHYGPNLEGAL